MYASKNSGTGLQCTCCRNRNGVSVIGQASFSRGNQVKEVRQHLVDGAMFSYKHAAM